MVGRRLPAYRHICMCYMVRLLFECAMALLVSLLVRLIFLSLFYLFKLLFLEFVLFALFKIVFQ